MSPSAEELAAIAVVGASFGAVLAQLAVPVPLAVAVVGIAVLSLRPRFVLGALVLLLAARATASVADLTAAASRPVELQWVRLVSDPRPDGSRWTAQGELDGERLFMVARAGAAADLARASMGMHVSVSGTVRGRAATSAWSRSRRIVGTLDVTEVHDLGPPSPAFAAASWLRDHIADGAAGLSPARRALFTGLVYGDDRHQTAVAADDFRAAGLGHLLAVSGQNVLFVLVLAAPLLSRIAALERRLIATLVVLVAFGFVTRFEPSVTRALVMAGLAAAAATRGNPSSALRLLPAAVVGLLLYDPLLGYSLAFQLSVAATGGLVLFTSRIEAILAGPAPLRTALSATMGAQLAVAPLLVTTIGSVSPLAIPANLLAAPAAAFVMMWGLTAGVVAGFSTGLLPAILHLPTQLALWWLESVASTTARVPTGQFGVAHISVLAIGVMLWRVRSTHVRVAARVLCLLALTTPILLAPPLPAGHHRLADGLFLTRSVGGTDVIVMHAGVRAEPAIEALREAGVRRIDLLVATSGGRDTGRTVAVVASRHDVTDIWAPPDHNVPGARVMPQGGGKVGSLAVEPQPDGSVSVYSVSDRAAMVTADDPASRAPPRRGPRRRVP